MNITNDTHARLTAIGLTESVFASAAKSLTTKTPQAAHHIHVVYNHKQHKFHGFLHGKTLNPCDHDTLHKTLSGLGYDKASAGNMIDAFQKGTAAGEPDHVCCSDIEHAWKHARAAHANHMAGNANGRVHHLRIAHSFLDRGLKLLGSKSEGRAEHLTNKIADIQTLTKGMKG